MKKVIATCLSATLALMMAAGCGNSNTGTSTSGADTSTSTSTSTAEAKTWKLATDMTATDPVTMGLEKISEELAATCDTLAIDVYPDGQLGQEIDTVEGVKIGTLEMAKVNSANMTGYVPQLNAYSLPYIVKDFDTAWRALEGDAGDFIKAETEKLGFKVVCFLEEGSRYIFLKDHFVEEADDLQGMKIRTMNSTAQQDGFKALGCSPTPMSFGEVYTAIQQGVVDGAENSIGNIYTYKMYEVAPYITDTAHMRSPQLVITSTKLFDSLTADEQTALLDAGEAASQWERNYANEQQSEFEKKIIEAGGQIQDLPEETRQAFIEILTPLYDQYKAENGAELVDAILNA
ncbi:MAG: TRAP transporter substrate-binding protein [Eubacteriales bacterium]|jgi:tripartite ATP-independent transporter DctP family solute receptor